MKRVFALGLLVAACVFAQSKTATYYNAANKLQYVCETGAVFAPVTTTWSVAASTLTNIVVTSNVGVYTTVGAHQLFAGARVTNTGSAGTAVDGTFTVKEVLSSTTFSADITTANGTYTTGLVVTTTDPLLNVEVWSIDVLTYNTAGYFTGTFKAGAGKSVAHTMKCSDRILY